MKDIKPYLHLYIGSYVSIRNLDSKYIRVLDYNFFNDFYDEDDDEFLNDPKLILRRLSDMSEEAKELCKLQTIEKRWTDVEVHDISHSDIHYTDGSKLYGDGVEELNDRYVHFDSLNAEQFSFLLRSGFDIFDLIDSGLAIDKKTLNT